MAFSSTYRIKVTNTSQASMRHHEHAMWHRTLHDLRSTSPQDTY